MTEMKFPRADRAHWGACYCLLEMKTALGTWSQDCSGGPVITALYHGIVKSVLSCLHLFRWDGDPLNDCCRVDYPQPLGS